MKKVLFAIFVMFGMALYANAQTAQCKIIGSSDGATATVAIDSYDLERGTVTVGFYNDSEQTATIIATVENSTGTTNRVNVVATLSPRSSTSKAVAWRSTNKPDKIKIESAKCQK